MRAMKRLAIVIAAVLSVGVLSGCDPRAGIPDNGAVTGMFVSNARGGGPFAAVTATMEGRLGYTMGGHRIYQGDFLVNSTSDTQLRDDAAHGRTSYFSVHSPTDAITCTWGCFAYQTGLMNQLAQQLGAYSHPIVFVLDHEPDVGTTPHGTRQEYSAMEANMFHAIRQYAPAVSTAINFGYYKLWKGQLTQAQYAEYLPSDRTLLDIIGVDPYNDATSPAGSASLQNLMTPWIAFAADENKPVVIFEVGTRLAAGNKPQWVQAALAYVKSQPRIKGILWFHANTHATDPVNDYWIDGNGTDTQSFNAYKTSTSDPYFLKGG